MSERERVIAIFEIHRKVPGAAYDPAHFLDYLLDSPGGKRAVYNSFAGLRRFNAFVDQIQMEYSVCLSLKDREANYSLDRFVARIDELRKSPRSSLASLQNQMKPGVEWHIVLVSNLGLILPALAFRHNPIVLAAFLTAVLCLNCFWFRFYRRERRYKARLHQQILAAARDET